MDAQEAKKSNISGAAMANDAHVSSTGLPNVHLDELESDFLYHIGYSRHELKEKFGDVKVRVPIASYHLHESVCGKWFLYMV